MVSSSSSAPSYSLRCSQFRYLRTGVALLLDSCAHTAAEAVLLLLYSYHITAICGGYLPISSRSTEITIVPTAILAPPSWEVPPLWRLRSAVRGRYYQVEPELEPALPFT